MANDYKSNVDKFQKGAGFKKSEGPSWKDKFSQFLEELMAEKENGGPADEPTYNNMAQARAVASQDPTAAQSGVPVQMSPANGNRSYSTDFQYGAAQVPAVNVPSMTDKLRQGAAYMMGNPNAEAASGPMGNAGSRAYADQFSYGQMPNQQMSMPEVPVNQSKPMPQMSKNPGVGMTDFSRAIVQKMAPQKRTFTDQFQYNPNSSESNTGPSWKDKLNEFAQNIAKAMRTDSEYYKRNMSKAKKSEE